MGFAHLKYNNNLFLMRTYLGPYHPLIRKPSSSYHREGGKNVLSLMPANHKTKLFTLNQTDRLYSRIFSSIQYCLCNHCFKKKTETLDKSMTFFLPVITWAHTAEQQICLE